ncbi:glutamate transport system substrate-binding protein [Friedmanniella endophytica]|uniref:Glutamate transport system substrate-binding protein n=1 Tax=Microlunatus kandeliicorticis TaxID=1759536 RepID=A0A7W3IPV9_9ACTN|nr:glutamate ABC transporter substrate-binding protein [Microlunatus kandeliicorticis]MBA8793067.1 glutamate transport system substrate-binding protein [Microlunatus kandeliicorticis]
MRAASAVLVVLSTVALLGAAGCSSDASPGTTPSPVPGASSGGSLTIGISFDQPGIGLKDGDTYTGFDVDTATYVAQALGVPKDKITWKEADPADRETLLTSGQVDLVFSSYSITSERRKVVDFAGPYFVAHQDLLVRRNDTDITGPETLDGRTLCSVRNTTSAQRVTQFYRGKITLREYPKFSDCVAALAAGDVDAVSTDDVILAGYAAEPRYRGKLRLVGKGFSDEEYGVGVKKGDTVRVQQVEAALKQYVADGSWRRSLARNVEPSGYAIPDPPTIG